MPEISATLIAQIINFAFLIIPLGLLWIWIVLKLFKAIKKML
jgi:hypothetical protein